MLIFINFSGENMVFIHCSLYFAACLKYFITQKKKGFNVFVFNVTISLKFSYAHNMYNTVFIMRKNFLYCIYQLKFS